MDKRFLGILASIIVVFAGIFAISAHSSNKSTGSSGSVQATNHVEGQGTSGVTLVEYGDYECPICGSYYVPLKQVFAEFSSKIYFQFRNLPLTQIHPNAFAGARAAEAAGLQNQYWQMHDQLYDNQDPIGKSGWVASSDPLSYFTVFAKQIGLDVNQFKTDYASSKVNDAINADLAAFAKTGKDQATPTFFLDGKYIDNSLVSDPQTHAPSVDKFAAVLNAEITAKTKH